MKKRKDVIKPSIFFDEYDYISINRVEGKDMNATVVNFPINEVKQPTSRETLLQTLHESMAKERDPQRRQELLAAMQILNNGIDPRYEMAVRLQVEYSKQELALTLASVLLMYKQQGLLTDAGIDEFLANMKVVCRG